MDDKGIVKLLTQGPSPLPAKHVNSLLKHFGKAVDHFRSSDWEECNGKAGKFVEATLKALADVAKVTPPAGRAFKVEAVVNLLRQTPPGSADDSVRIVIPRCCTFIYDIASNRGGRHDPGEVDPNEMDAAAAVANMSWVVAEMIRYAQKGAVNLAEAKQLVESLTERKYPFMEDVDGRLYFHKKGKSAPDVALVALARRHPARISKEDLVKIVARNGFEEHNARMALARISHLVDDDGAGRLRLLAPGREKADEIMRSAADA